MKKIIITLLAFLGVSSVGLFGGSFYNRINNNREVSDTLITTESTTTTIKTITLVSPTSTTHIVANIVANGIGDATTSTYGAGFHCVATFKNVSSTVSQIGSTVCDKNFSSSLGFDFATSSGQVLLRVNGLTSSTFNWQSFTEVYSIQ